MHMWQITGWVLGAIVVYCTLRSLAEEAAIKRFVYGTVATMTAVAMILIHTHGPVS